jgi:hypothetical protein
MQLWSQVCAALRIHKQAPLMVKQTAVTWFEFYTLLIQNTANFAPCG